MWKHNFSVTDTIDGFGVALSDVMPEAALLLVAVLAFAMAAFATAPAAADNLIGNPGFEAPSANDPCDYGTAVQTGNWHEFCTVERAAAPAPGHGSWSGRINEADCAGGGYLYQDASFSAASDFEFSAWVYPVSGTAQLSLLFDWDRGGGTTSGHSDIVIYPTETDFNAWGQAVTGPPITYNAWHQLRLVADANTSTAQLFIDGTPAGTSAPGTPPAATSSGTILLGHGASCNAAGDVYFDDVSLAYSPPPSPPTTTVTSGPSGMITSDSATFTFSASDPGSSFECALDSSAFTACSSPYTTPPLPAGAHTFSVRARNASGAGAPDSRSFTIAGAPQSQAPAPVATQSQALPPPVLGQTVNTAPVSGTVRVRLPGTNKFVELKAGQQLPVGSVVDTTKGVVRLTSAAGAGAGTQAANFYQGVFVISQSKNGVTNLRLTGGSFSGCAAAGSRRRASGSRRHKKSSSGSTVRKLWGDGTGKFKTTGHYSSAAVRGTIWLVADRCDGTLTKVKRGTVTVRDFVRKRKVIVSAADSYLARKR